MVIFVLKTSFTRLDKISRVRPINSESIRVSQEVTAKRDKASRVRLDTGVQRLVLQFRNLAMPASYKETQVSANVICVRTVRSASFQKCLNQSNANLVLLANFPEVHFQVNFVLPDHFVL
jgi:hypothetical protein